jgi:tetratricopeptide (TPR) repeat protein
MGDLKGWREEYELAKKYSEKATEKERLYIEADYARAIKGDSLTYLSLMEQLVQKYPREKQSHFDFGDYLMDTDLPRAIEEITKALELDPQFGPALNSLGMIYRKTGDYEKSLEFYRRYSAVYPGDADPFDSMAWTYLRKGDLDRAQAKFKEALEAEPDYFYSLKGMFYISALKQDYPEAKKWADRLISMAKYPNRIIEGYWCRALLEFWLGQFKGALETLREASDLADKISNKNARIFADYIRGCIHFERGEFELGLKYLRVCWEYETRTYPLSRPLNKIIYAYELGLIELELGRIDSARSKLAEIKANLTKLGNMFNWDISSYYDFLSAEILLREGKAKAAIGLLAKMPPQRPPVSFGGSLYPIVNNFPALKDVLARAYQQNGETDKAIAECARLVTIGPSNPSRALIHPLYYYRLARLYEQKGLKAKAVEQYRSFLDLWRDADAGLPEVADAKKRLAGL